MINVVTVHEEPIEATTGVTTGVTTATSAVCIHVHAQYYCTYTLKKQHILIMRAH